MKNYYELLEVNENASPEVIERAYKVLAKRYHPDVQPRDKAFLAEAEFKKIGEAYRVLSDPERRIIYDFENGFAETEVSAEEKYNQLYYEQEKLKKELSSLKGGNSSTQTHNEEVKPVKPLSISRFKSTFQSLAQGLYNETSKNNKDRSKNLKALFLTVAIMTLLVILFWNVPFLRNILFP